MGTRQTRGRRRYNPGHVKIVVQYSIAALLVVVLCIVVGKNIALNRADKPGPTDEPTVTAPVGGGDEQETPEPGGETESPAPEETPVSTPEPEPFEPHSVDSTASGNYLQETGIMLDGEMVTEGYEDDTGIYFGYPEEYSALPGVITFRGNNFRDSAAYGTANITQKQFGKSWTATTGSLTAPDGAFWSGNGWTGQPLIVEWPKETRQIMNMYDWAKQAETLVEVVYPAMDGYIYFLELETGKPTRDSLNLGFTFKGTGTLDPRGYPLLYVGSGYNSYNGTSHVFVVSLIDFSILYEFGAADGFALRGWPMYDSAPLIDAETDKLIYCGESGVIYIITLGTQYDEEAGTISVNRTRAAKWRYMSIRYASTGQYWLGFEASPVIWQGHLICPDNGGHLICLDLDTLTVDWVQDTLDDTNCTPVLEIEDGHPYIYASTSFHLGWRSYNTATVPVWKIDAVTGEIVWQTDYECYSVAELSGGTQGSIAVGKENVSDLIYVPIARTPTASGGKLVALDKETGEQVWEFVTQVYSWSTPTLVYDQNGDAYVLYCTTGHYIYLLDARTGEMLDSENLGGLIEASPAVYGNWLVVGHRSGTIYGIELT